MNTLEAAARMVLCTLTCPVCLSILEWEADADEVLYMAPLPLHARQAVPDSEMTWAESHSDPALCPASEQLVHVVACPPHETD